MARLFGTDHSAQSLAERAGGMTQVGGVRLVAHDDGASQGVRIPQFKTGFGLAFSVAVDCATDITSLSHNGRPIGWHSPASRFAPHNGSNKESA